MFSVKQTAVEIAAAVLVYGFLMPGFLFMRLVGIGDENAWVAWVVSIAFWAVVAVVRYRRRNRRRH